MNSNYKLGVPQYFTPEEKARLRQLSISQAQQVRSREDVVLLRLGIQKLDGYTIHFLGYDQLDVQLKELKRPRAMTISHMSPVVSYWTPCTERQKTWSHAVTYADDRGTFWCDDDQYGLYFLQIFGLDGTGRSLAEIEQEERTRSEEREKNFEQEFGVEVEIEMEPELEAAVEAMVHKQERLRQQYDAAVRDARTDLEQTAGVAYYVYELDEQKRKTRRGGPFLRGQAELVVLTLEAMPGNEHRAYAIEPETAEIQQ